MPGITRVSDISLGICGCCCDSCPHQWMSVHVQGSPDVFANGLSAMRAPGDVGSSTCPHCPASYSVTGSANVVINGRMAHRVGDVHIVACGTGIVISGSPDVRVNG